ncbi:Protein CHLOROPLAST IMPORT APPARATUS 2 like [Actinidia chinensis var. chinensis]|uniref:Protein CHLOROPLAST IMPORT APPARATUS 2 like n=1 Tax=Actinidia chinensis var. chinensis TaxID=1590841 RepID=A0A2R6S279_ACTCC|nr:Protein CHLOROPLAST IMPORT APPARATUS 2 like [Actinidia chinensis var. chinensis]
MSSCLSGGARYGLELEIVKSLSSSTITSNSSSLSSSLSESSNSPLAISTRKARTPRKRPNQTYNEAAKLLSTANPNLFSPKHLLTKPCKFTSPNENFLCDSTELLLPFRVFDNSGFLLHHPVPEKPNFRNEARIANSHQKSCGSPAENEFHSDFNGYGDDFDAESMLDEEIEEGIDSIMGNLSVENESNAGTYRGQISTCYGYPMGMGFGGNFDSGFGMRIGVRPLRNVDEGEWWRFPTVDVVQISPKLNKYPAEKKKKKIERPAAEAKILKSPPKGNSIPKQEERENSIPIAKSGPPPGLLLKLNYDGVANAWSDRGSPFSEEIPGHESDLHARLGQIDLFSENGGVREASVLRYKEKRRTRLFSRKIRYQVRKINADRRPRMKGRFVRRPNSPMSEER